MKVYIMGVGTRDPHWRSEDNKRVEFNKLEENYDLNTVKEGPILSFFKILLKQQGDPSPFRVYLIPTDERESQQGTLKGGEKTKEFLEKLFKDESCCNYRVFVRPITVGRPNDHGELYPEMRRVIKKIREETEERNPEYFINLQPGTPQMGHIFISLAMLGVINPRFVEIRDGKIIKEINLSFMFEGEILRRGKELLKDGHFSTAERTFKELREVAVELVNQRKSEIFMKLSEIYSLWDKLRYKEAYNKINNLLNDKDIKNYPQYKSLRDILEEQKKSLSLLKGGDRREYVVDLYHSSRRRLRQGDFPDALWRLVTIYEVTLKWKAIEAIERETGVKLDPENFDKSVERNWNNQEIRRLINRVFGGGTPPSVLEADKAKEILEWYGDPFLKIVSSFQTSLNELKKRRNNLVHGMELPQEGKVKNDLKTIQDLIKEAFCPDDPNSYAFSLEKIESVAEIIGGIYGRA